MPQMRLLFLSYYFQPQTSVGVHRTTRFLRHLADHEMSAEVITVANPDPQFCPVDKKAQSVDTFCDAPVHRVAARNVKPYWQLPTAIAARLGRMIGVQVDQERIAEQFWHIDMHWGFMRPAKKKLVELADSRAFDAIYVSCPPHSAAVAAFNAAQFTGLPLILDFRDSWVASPYARRKTLSYDALERRMLEGCAALIVNTPDDIDLYKDRIDPAKVHMINNGFDEPLQGPFHRAPRAVGELLQLLYLGAWDNRARDPALLLDALMERQEPWQLVSHGSANEPLVQAAEARGLTDKVVAKGFVAKEQIGEVICAADALVLLQGAPAPGVTNTHIAAKTFDYLATGKPILALAAQGANRDFLGQYSNHTLLADPADRGAVVAALDRLFARHAAGELPVEPDQAFLAEYSGAALTAKLATVVRESIQRR